MVHLDLEGPRGMDQLRPGASWDPGYPSESFEQHVRHWEDHGFGRWVAVEAASDRACGWIGASHPTFVPMLAQEVEITWTLDPARWGRGLATEGARASVEAAYRNLDHERVISLIHPGNVCSAAVAERL